MKHSFRELERLMESIEASGYYGASFPLVMRNAREIHSIKKGMFERYLGGESLNRELFAYRDAPEAEQGLNPEQKESRNAIKRGINKALDELDERFDEVNVAIDKRWYRCPNTCAE